eukprot:symbB.v1.2.014148.t1/scaffold1025.1/size143318/8
MPSFFTSGKPRRTLNLPKTFRHCSERSRSLWCVKPRENGLFAVCFYEQPAVAQGGSVAEFDALDETSLRGLHHLQLMGPSE